MKIGEFIEQLSRLGLEYFRRYYGPYRAIVVSNDDPEFRGRIRVSCPRAKLHPENGHWLLPMSGTGDGTGTFFPPEKDAVVWIFFDNGDPNQPLCYQNGWFPKETLSSAVKPESGGPKKRGFTTPGGHEIVLSDKDGEEQITIKHKDGLIVDITESEVKIGASDGTFEPIMRGTTVQRYLETHQHPHAFGPTGPPIQPFPLDGLSKEGKVS